MSRYARRLLLPDAETEAAMTPSSNGRRLSPRFRCADGDAVPLSLWRDELAQRLDQECISQRFSPDRLTFVL
ncbi:hypothetical protein ACNKHX_17175 [Shigella flexneri]